MSNFPQKPKNRNLSKDELYDRLEQDERIAPVLERARAKMAAYARERDLRNRQIAVSCVGLLLCGGMVGAGWSWIKSADGEISAEKTYTTAQGEYRQRILDDGSEITLDENTIVKVEILPEERRLHVIRGRVHVAVQKSPIRFVSRIDDTEVVALGTAFTLRVLPAGSDVALTEGTVCIRDLGSRGVCGWQGGPQGGKRMTEGHRLTIDKNPGGTRRIFKDNLDRDKAWARGELLLPTMPVAQVVKEVNRYSSKKIVINGDLKGATLSGPFPIGDTRFVAELLERQGLVQVAYKPDSIVVTAVQK